MVRGITAQVAPRLPGARFVVTNRPGAGGQLGFEANFNAAPDGYTLGAATNTAMNAISVERTPRYRPAEFTYIANVVDDPAAFWVHPDSPWKTWPTSPPPPRRSRRPSGSAPPGWGRTTISCS